MAPTVYKPEIGTKKTNLRKPAVEKLRRDRINKCIEQLKALLKTEIKANQPCCKLEKADVLEMAVIYLKKSTQHDPDAHAQSYADGFSRCLQETARFLSVHNQLQITKPALTEHFDRTQQPKTSAKVVCASAPKDSCHVISKRAGAQALWRPW
ncbi:hairy-related 2 [Misgurnus anguillicaudatus]|uniref:hairy-related 2 n=1 Tax=Misgurnus anguillicaudatus TaxID=75329 RepID=UPI003CCFD0FF